MQFRCHSIFNNEHLFTSQPQSCIECEIQSTFELGKGNQQNESLKSIAKSNTFSERFSTFILIIGLPNKPRFTFQRFQSPTADKDNTLQAPLTVGI